MATIFAYIVVIGLFGSMIGALLLGIWVFQKEKKDGKRYRTQMQTLAVGMIIFLVIQCYTILS